MHAVIRQHGNRPAIPRGQQVASRAPEPQFRRIPWESVDWEHFEAYADRNLFQSRPWLEFLAEIQGGQLVAAVLTDGGVEVGRFHGLVIKRLGFKFLGSPLPGWTTPYMGFNLSPGIEPSAAARALVD